MIAAVLRALRPSFLLLTPAVSSLAPAALHVGGRSAAMADIGLLLLGALAAHAAVNLLNEWVDFRSGLDLHTRRTPFSGGSGALPAQPAAATAVAAAALACLGMTIAVGLYFLQRRGAWLLLPGLSGLALVLLYSPWLNRHPWACLLAPGLGLGCALVLGGEIALGGHPSAAGALASLLPLCLASNLLLLNQLPDREADARAGRRHWVVVHGPASAVRVYARLSLLAAAVPPLAVLSGPWPPAVLLALLPFPLAGFAAWRASHWVARAPRTPEALLPALAANVALCLTAPPLFALGAWLGG